jgi:hypothetical protein
MKKIFILIVFIINIFSVSYKSDNSNLDAKDDVAALKEKLYQLSVTSSNMFFANHCSAFLSVINSKSALTWTDSSLLNATYEKFNDTAIDGNPSYWVSYTSRQRPIILSWVSPTDGTVSYVRIRLPKDWDIDKEYPLYIELHGLWDVAANPIDYMTYSFRGSPSTSMQYEDGYAISPWGRGNLWYKGISETDIWEGIAEIEKIFKIDPARKYLNGHSMGGFGAWYIASRSVYTWAALGIHAGALWYDHTVMSDEVFETLKDMPTYFVCGTSDGLLGINQTAYDKLSQAGNTNLKFVTFEGGHDYHSVNVDNMYLWMREFTNEYWPLTIKNSPKEPIIGNLIHCYPNPVHTQGQLTYIVESPSEVSVKLFDLYGREQKQLEKAFRYPGEYNIYFDTNSLPTGIYNCKANIGVTTVLLKVMVIK